MDEMVDDDMVDCETDDMVDCDCELLMVDCEMVSCEIDLKSLTIIFINYLPSTINHQSKT